MNDEQLAHVVTVEHRHALRFDALELATKSTATDVHFVEKNSPELPSWSCEAPSLQTATFSTLTRRPEGFRDLDKGVNSQLVVEQTLANRRDRSID